MSKSTPGLVRLPTAAPESPVRVHQKNIENLEKMQRDVALKIIWEYDPESEEDFPLLMDAFVRCVGTKAKAGRLLLVPPVTMHRWLAGVQAPRIFLRASFKAQMIQLLSEDHHTSPDGTDRADQAAANSGELQRRRLG